MGEGRRSRRLFARAGFGGCMAASWPADWLSSDTRLSSAGWVRHVDPPPPHQHTLCGGSHWRCAAHAR